MAEKKNNGYNSLYERFGVLKDLTLKEEDRYPAVNRAAAMSRSIPSSPVVEPIKADTTLTPPAPATPSAPKSSNILNQLPVNKEDTYWGQNVGKTNIPLDKFVQMAGMFSRMLNPEDPGGIGKELTQMGGAASAGRAQREYDAPNRLLQMQMQQLQKDQLQQGIDKTPVPYEVFMKDRRDKGYLNDIQNLAEWRKEGLRQKEAELELAKKYKDPTKAPKGVVREMKNPDFNPNKPDSVTNPRHIKRVVADTELGGTVPIVDEFTKAGVKATEKKAVTSRAEEGLQIRRDQLKVSQDSFKLKQEIARREKQGLPPTAKQIADAEEIILRLPTDPAMEAQAELVNKYGKKDYTWEQQEVEVEIDVDKKLMDPTTWTGGTETEKQMQWVKQSKQKTTTDVKTLRAQAKEAIDSGDFNTDAIKEQFKSLTGQDYD